MADNSMVEYLKKLFGIICIFLLLIFQQARGDSSALPKTIKTKSGIEMVQVPAGWFIMGDENGQIDEKPHRVFVNSFYMDKYEVTQQEYEKVMTENPSKWKGGKNCVEQIRWSDAVRYCNKRSRAEGLRSCYDLKTWKCDFNANGYRLPTEAEWEYAARAGTKITYFFDNNSSKLKHYAWFGENSGKRARPVGKKLPNPWGLYDIYGNVWEWCNDFYQVDYYQKSPEKNPQGPETGDTKVLRGGCWDTDADKCRSSFRYNENPAYADACFGYDIYGFRCVRRSQDSSKTDAVTKKTGFVYHKDYLGHNTGPTHPEAAGRLKAIIERLKQKDILSSLVQIEANPAPIEWLTSIHTSEYIRRVEDACTKGRRNLDSSDTPVSSRSYDVARLAVGGVLNAIDAVMAGQARNVFCAVRPPGHHALKDQAMGFCLFNNVAIAARYIQKKYKLSKVLIMDWDVHHGNGTQAAFYDDADVLYFSVHQHPFYPGTGREEETGAGKGKGYTINVPLPVGAGNTEFIEAFRSKLKPAALAFKPDFVLISAGFDAHKDDPLGGMNVTDKGFAELTSIAREIAEKCCQGRLVSVLEGGYDYEGLASSVETHILNLQKRHP